MADSKVIDALEKATGKTREECEQALTASNGNYGEAVAKLGSTRSFADIMDLDAGVLAIASDILERDK